MKYISIEKLNTFAVMLWSKISSNFVRKESGKGLSTNDYTSAEKDKLKGLNNTVVDSALSGTSTNPLQNKAVNEALNAKVPTARKINNKALSTDISLTAADVGALAAGTKGAANGVAELDANGTVPSSQLPSYVDDVLEYTARASFPGTGETGKIYVDTTANKTYRWSGSTYVVISDTIALGETSSTALRGDWGKTAYNHSLSSHARLDATAVGASAVNGCIMINGKEEEVYVHPVYAEKASGLYKITIDMSGHVSGVSLVTKADITALGIPGQDTNTTYALVTTATAGLMSALDKARLDELVGILESGFYKHPDYVPRSNGLYKITVDALGHISAVAAVTKSDITALGIPGQDTNTTYVAMVGATPSASGAAGLVPVPAAGASNRYLRSDGTWQVPPDTNTVYTHPSATAYASGLYKITVNNLGHITSATAVTKADITALGIPGQDTNTVYTHPNSGVPAGTYRSVSVNAQGHVTSGSNPTTLSGYGITDAANKNHPHTVADITDLEIAADADIDSIIAGTYK